MNRNEKIYTYTMIISMLLFIGGISMINVFSPNKTFSEAENRKLEQFPLFSFRNVIDKQFTKKYETYISDQFVFRDVWVAMKSSAERMIGKIENNGVYIGNDGSLIQKFESPKEREVQARIAAINDFDQDTPDVNKYVMLVPTAISIQDNKLSKYVSHTDELMYINKVKGSLHENIKFIDTYDTLRLKKDEYIYYKTDHHWTTKGAFYAYQELSRQMNVIPQKEEAFNVRKITNNFYGSLYSKGGFRGINPDCIELYVPKNKQEYRVEYIPENKQTTSFYEMDNVDKKDKYTVFFGGNHPLIKITNNNATGKKLLVVKDSYANSILPFLEAHFSEIYVVDLRYYKENVKTLLQEHHIKDMLILYNGTTFFEDASIKTLSE
ncbi:hypothetical protein COC69_15820 [Bacillus cereus]|uniref:DHHW protein n=1 Tax=Bacillus cereus TaxID=1396 RepID=A0A9X7CMC5_BACCE|nr:DHHW family protein [Bacillus cereus]PGS78311.1 hypothetical protein COC69_15820 [Bacillus cereus]